MQIACQCTKDMKKAGEMRRIEESFINAGTQKIENGTFCTGG
jgi:hypothetical protein